MTDEGGADDWVRRATATDPPSGPQPGPEDSEAEQPELRDDELHEDELTAGEPDDQEEEAASRRPASARRSAGFAAGRALVILVAAGIGWYLVVPTHHTARNRLSMLVISKPGVAAYEKTKPQAGEQDDTQTGVAALTAAAKKSPNQTGVYSIEWSPSQTSGAGVVALLFPNQADAATAVSQLSNQQLSPDANSANSLTRTATFTVPGVPGSAGSVFSPSSKTDPTLATALFRHGRVVSLTQVVGSAETAKPDSTTLAVNQYATLSQVEPGFTLSVKDYPLVPSVLWGAGAVVIAALAALGPILWRRRAEKRQLAYEAELASQVVVGGKVIVKHRR
jgi:hypothetical protein